MAHHATHSGEPRGAARCGAACAASFADHRFQAFVALYPTTTGADACRDGYCRGFAEDAPLVKISVVGNCPAYQQSHLAFAMSGG